MWLYVVLFIAWLALCLAISYGLGRWLRHISAYYREDD